MMKQKIPFTELLSLYDNNQIKLKIDNKYIYKKDNNFYFINIDFNCFNYRDNQAQYIQNGISKSIQIPNKIYDNDKEIYFETIQISFYCCSFITEMPPFNNKIKIFYRCDFKKISKKLNTILLKKCTFDNITNSMHNIEGGIINNLLLINNTWATKYYINKQYNSNSRKTIINTLRIENTIFKENFKLHNCEIRNISIQDTDFEKHADFFKTIFDKGISENKLNNIPIYFKAINFKGLALFGDTEFKTKVIFKYITFESFSHFRRAVFHKGLDLDYSNIQQEMNFFGAKKLEGKDSRESTSQETYRIIKHNFEKIGNRIEANKYFALELEQKKLNIKKEKPFKFFDYIIFQINWLSSEFGTNWIRVLFLICNTGLITVSVVNIEIFKELFFNPSLFKFDFIYRFFNELSHYVYILDKSDKLVSIPILFLFNKVVLGYLYYQLITSIRKDTKR